MTKKYRIGLIPVIMAFVLPFLVRMAYVHVPLERDEGAYAYGAWRMLEGDVLYKDMVDFTPPGIFYLYASAIKFFGKGIDDIRFFTCIYMEFVLLWMFFLLKRIFTSREAWIGTAVLGFIAAEPAILGFTANKETFLLLPIIASIHLMLKGIDEHKKWLLVTAGCISGLGFFIKQQMLFFSVCMALFTIVHQWQKKDRGLIPVLLFTAGGVLAGCAVCIFFFMKGAFKPFFYWVFTYTLEFGTAPVDKIVMLSYLRDRIGAILAGDVIFWAAGIYAVYMLIAKKAWQGWLIVCLIIAAALSVSAGFRFRQHYFILAAPVVAMSAGWGIARWIDAVKRLQRKMVRYILLSMLGLLIVGIPLRSNWAYMVKDSPEEISRKLYGTNPFVEAVHIAQYIKEHTNPDDAVFVFGSEPEIYFYSERINPVKHFFIYPLTALYGLSGAFQREAVSAVKEAEPFYIIWVDIQTSLYASEPSSDRYVFEEIKKHIQEQYKFDGYVLIGRHESLYMFGARELDPAHREEKIPVYLYQKKSTGAPEHQDTR